uniref:Methyl-CpG-binding domain protein 1 n=1 Tax=Malurus cyaneus samueli TaxID=2593467 RepID=A0A8C5TI08_9PASS
MAEGWAECPALGPGWQRREAFRKSGATSGRSDTYYRSPTGQKFRSKIELRRFLGPGHDLSNFDFKSGLERPGPTRVWGLGAGRVPKNVGRGHKNQGTAKNPGEGNPGGVGGPSLNWEGGTSIGNSDSIRYSLSLGEIWGGYCAPPKCLGVPQIPQGVWGPAVPPQIPDTPSPQRVGCGLCQACRIPEDCGICSACSRNSPGGPSGPARTPKCLLRRCLRIVKKQSLGCGSCAGCLNTEDCGSCCICLRRLQPGLKRQWRCLRRRCLRPKVGHCPQVSPPRVTYTVPGHP